MTLRERERDVSPVRKSDPLMSKADLMWSVDDTNTERNVYGERHSSHGLLFNFL